MPKAGYSNLLQEYILKNEKSLKSHIEVEKSIRETVEEILNNALKKRRSITLRSVNQVVEEETKRIYTEVITQNEDQSRLSQIAAYIDNSERITPDPTFD